MAGFVNKFVIGASVLVGMSAVGVAPAQAQFQIGGAEDVKLYNSDGTNTYEDPSADINVLLQGDSSNPTGNVELSASDDFTWKDATSIEGMYQGQNLTISSLTEEDWFGGDSSYGNNFATTYFNAFFDAAVQDSFIGQLTSLFGLPSFMESVIESEVKSIAYYEFLDIGFFQTASDPNISYVDNNGEDLMVGLAGHNNLWQKDGLKAEVENALNPFFNFLNFAIFEEFGINPGFSVANVFNETIQFSEAVKISYGDQVGTYFGTYTGNSGLVAADDGYSHNGNYQVTLSGVIEPPASVPEPSTMLGLMAVGGLFAAAKHNSKKA